MQTELEPNFSRPSRLDSALTRSGRFDRSVEIQLPDKVSREELLRMSIADRPHVNDIDFDIVAGQTTGLSSFNFQKTKF